MIDVLVLTYFDFSNTGWRFSKMLESLDLKVKMFKGRLHEYNYPIQAEVFEPLANGKLVRGYPIVAHCPELAPWVEEAKIIHFTSSTFISTGVDLSNKKVVVQHGGSTFRHGANAVNALFNRLVDYSIIQCPDLLGLGAKNETLIYYPVDTESLQPDYEKRGDKLVFGHFPSSPASKGTGDIVKLMMRLKKSDIGDKFEYVGVTDAVKKQTDWPAHLDRVRGCDVLIETVLPFQRGKKFGEFGNQCFEASALGKIVVTNNIEEERYIKEYGTKPVIFKANDIEQAEIQIRRIVEMSDDEILEAKMRGREWVENTHSMKVTANRLWDKVYGKLL